MISLKARHAIKAINDSQILQKLERYNPVVVSTILVGLDTEDSDIDIVCSYNSQFIFFQDLQSLVEGFFDGICKQRNNYVLARFEYAEYLFEIFGTNQKVEAQMAFRHYQIMQRLSRIGGTNFQNTVKAIKKTGIKTEPAIALILQLEGNPYHSVLMLEQLNDEVVEELLLRSLKP
ncbi:MAG: DUF4269 domain-containing protein [Cyanobacteria bacterium P01_G01_bin.49]